MQIVIDIPEEIYKARQHWVANPKRMIDEVDIAIANSTPLPKGHGRLIDESKIAIIIETEDGDDFITDAPTIIEADKEN